MLIWGVIWLFSGVVAQLIRYHRERDPTARQQTKWVLFGFATLATMTLLTFIPPLLFREFREPGRPLVIYILIAAPAVMAGMAMVPLSIGFSVLRYGLWDIDTIVNKALVYGALSSVLVVIFFASVLLIQRLVDLVTGQTQGSLATVLSTLLIAGLFTPLRQRIQHSIDRRFYRRKYDAARTLERFSSTVRDKVELDRLVVELLAVVDDTMQPEHVTLWLRPAVEGDSEPSPK